MKNNNNNKQIKGSHLKPNEICEYTSKCGIKNCSGKDKKRKFELSCGLRRGFFNSRWFWGCVWFNRKKEEITC